MSIEPPVMLRLSPDAHFAGWRVADLSRDDLCAIIARQQYELRQCYDRMTVPQTAEVNAIMCNVPLPIDITP